MNIGIDASRAFLDEKTGTEEYSHELIRHLAKIENSCHYFLLYMRRGTKVDLKLPLNFSVREIRGDFLWTQLALSKEMLKGEAEVLFIPSHTIPFIHPHRTVATIHGLESKLFPRCYSLSERIILRINTLLTVIFAAKIITPSQNTKNDLIMAYKITPAKITAISHGILKPKDDAKKKSDNEFNILFVGRLEKRKNIINVISAFEEFMQNTGDPNNLKINLILAGKKGFGFGEIEEKISRSPQKNNIVLPGYVSEEDKQRLYRQANLFLFPSYYEGFGLPVLEAMSSGVPVICSKTSALKEIAEGAALLVDPQNIEEISSAICDIFKNSKTRDELIQKGLERAENFSWRKCAEETLETLTVWQ